MSTITDTQRMTNPRDAHVRKPRRQFARAFALGATISTLAVGGAWVAVGDGHGVADGGTPAAASGATAAGGSAAGGSTANSHASSPSGHAQAAWVTALQRQLGQLNYYEGPVDGVLGPQTLAAITDFQRANGLTADGVVGPSTMAKISHQLKTGDSQMWPSAPPVKPSGTTPSNTHTGTGTGTSGTGTGGTGTGGTGTNETGTGRTGTSTGGTSPGGTGTTGTGTAGSGTGATGTEAGSSTSAATSASGSARAAGAH